MYKMLKGFFVALFCIFSLGTIPVHASEHDNIDANLGNSPVSGLFEFEVTRIKYLRERGKEFDEINRILSSERDIPYLDNYAGSHMNSLEKALYKENRAKALLCLANGKLAIQYSQELYKSSSLHNGNGDAFRHMLWNFGMARDVGQSFAKRWSDAHENGAKNQPSIEKTMDLHNNSIGLALARENPNVIVHSTFKSKTKEAVRAGRGKIISNNKLVKSSSNGEK